MDWVVSAEAQETRPQSEPIKYRPTPRPKCGSFNSDDAVKTVNYDSNGLLKRCAITDRWTREIFTLADNLREKTS
jgi:hypothetical protein